MDVKKFLSLVFLAALPLLSFGQSDTTQVKVWTLEDCIRYAREKNLNVQSAQVSLSSAESDIKQASAARLPGLSASISQGLTHARRDIESNESAYAYSANAQLSASMTLYNGGKLNNTLTQKKTDAQARAYDVARTRNDIEISVTQAYLQVLYARESVGINQKTVESSLSQVEQAKELYEAGSIALSDYAQMQSQYASDKYQLVAAQNTLDKSILDLKQLLELEAGYDFRLDFPEISDEQVDEPIPSSLSVYNSALQSMPEVKSAQLGIESAKLGEKIAKASGIPSLSLSAGIGTGYATTSSDAFARQLDRSLSENVGLSLSIPIFNNRNTRTAVEKARLESISADLSLQSVKKDLLSTVESLWQDAVSAQSRYQAACEQLRSAQISYDLVNQQFAEGMKNTVELLQEKNNYLSAQMEAVQAKYQAVLSIKLLNFYQNKPITL